MIEFPPDLQIKSSHKNEKNNYTSRVLKDFWLAHVSREASLMGRREVLTGKAKFGILGDGKELPQLALSHFFKKGDFRSGYYRDQTWMFALGLSDVQQYFAQLYADVENDPFSGGRQMNNHFATPFIDEQDNWLKHSQMYNVSSDISSTGGQMARAIGLATATKKFKEIPELDPDNYFSNKGEEITFCSIGDASTSEGVFWETMNAATVSRVPLCVMVWDDGYGISVPIELQTTKGSISKALEGFLIDENNDGILIYTVKAWDYPALINTFDKATQKIRKEHRPVLIHVQECTQPQGHSTSGSHERYKSKERLKWEKEFDGLLKMEEWILDTELADVETLERIKKEARGFVRSECKIAWKKFQQRNLENYNIIKSIYADNGIQNAISQELEKMIDPTFGEILANARSMRHNLIANANQVPDSLEKFIDNGLSYGKNAYETHLYSSTESSALNIPVVRKEISDASQSLNGFQIINTFFDKKFAEMPNAFAFGEDVGNIGDVNQGFAGLQEKYGSKRIFDTGIREWTIMGTAIGMAMRGLRPIAEIQYLDYLIYGLTPLTDDLATLRYRSNNLQMAPAIIRTRGHRLEGIWHAGSPLGMMLSTLHGIYICVPRNFVQAAGIYNTLLQSTDPAIVIEVLNGYRHKEVMPDNIGEYTVPLGVPEVIVEGSDLTLVTYGPNVRYAKQAIESLSALGKTIELIDVQTLMPFDLEHKIVDSLKKTNRILFLDEDVPGGSTAYMMQKVLEEQGGYYHLDAAPVCLSAKANRTAFGSDGDYFCKPQVGDIADAILNILSE